MRNWICIMIMMGMLAALQATAVPQAIVFTGDEWLPFNCQTLDSVDDYTVNTNNLERSKYGGWKAQRFDNGTGFFRVEKINGRWWAIDPEGYLFIHMALNSVHLDNFTADEIYQLLPQYGFNGTGSWSDEEIFDSTLKTNTPLAYCPKISFIAEYRRDRVPRIEMPVFDPAFETFCNTRAQDLSQYVNDPHVFGYFSDNELPWSADGLPAHLAITDTNDPNYIAAIDFLASRGKTASNWDDDDQAEYTVPMAERYFSVVSAAIQNVDTNHLYIGCRLNKSWKRVQGFMEAAGQYLDVVSINHYHRWGTRDVQIHNMAEWSGRPLIVTEFYAMEDMPFMETGAGWLVTNQAARGLFYHNYVTKMAESGDVVGWHWFKFQDDVDGNKGVVDTSGNLYTNLLSEMAQMNAHIYDYINYIDSFGAPDLSLLPEADAYFRTTVNYGADPELWIKNSPFAARREAYLRFDLSGVDPEVSAATIKLFGIARERECGSYQAELVADNTWGELTLTSNNNPPGSTVLTNWSHADDVEIDVTDELLAALALDQKLSIRVVATLNNGNIPIYGSRENTNAMARPKLLIRYRPEYEVWAEIRGLTAGVNDGYHDDPEGDGMVNLSEFALGAHPLTNDASLFLPTLEIAPADGTNWMNYLYRRRIDHNAVGLDYTVGSSTNLVSEPITNTTFEAGSVVLDENYEMVTNRVSIEMEAQQFMQLRVTKD